MIFPAGSYISPVATTRGFVVARMEGSVVKVCLLDALVPLWERTVIGSSLMFLRAASDGISVAIIGKHHTTGNAFVTINGDQWIDLGPTAGNLPVAIFHDGQEFVALVVRSPSTYERRGLTSGASALLSGPIGSQGIRYLNPLNMPVFGDQTLVRTDFGFMTHEWVAAGDLIIGQDHETGFRVITSDRTFRVNPGNVQFPQAVRLGDSYCLCGWFPFGSVAVVIAPPWPVGDVVPAAVPLSAVPPPVVTPFKPPPPPPSAATEPAPQPMPLPQLPVTPTPTLAAYNLLEARVATLEAHAGDFLEAIATLSNLMVAKGTPVSVTGKVSLSFLGTKTITSTGTL